MINLFFFVFPFRSTKQHKNKQHFLSVFFFYGCFGFFFLEFSWHFLWFSVVFSKVVLGFSLRYKVFSRVFLGFPNFANRLFLGLLQGFLRLSLGILEILCGSLHMFCGFRWF